MDQKRKNTFLLSTDRHCTQQLKGVLNSVLYDPDYQVSEDDLLCLQYCANMLHSRWLIHNESVPPHLSLQSQTPSIINITDESGHSQRSLQALNGKVSSLIKQVNLIGDHLSNSEQRMSLHSENVDVLGVFEQLNQLVPDLLRTGEDRKNNKHDRREETMGSDSDMDHKEEMDSERDQYYLQKSGKIARLENELAESMLKLEQFKRSRNDRDQQLKQQLCKLTQLHERQKQRLMEKYERENGELHQRIKQMQNNMELIKDQNNDYSSDDSTKEEQIQKLEKENTMFRNEMKRQRLLNADINQAFADAVDENHQLKSQVLNLEKKRINGMD